MMLDYLVDDNAIDISKDDQEFVKRLIDGVPGSEAYSYLSYLRGCFADFLLGCREKSDRGFMYEIVANKRNSVDVDKFDYISRDCHNVGLKTSYDFDRLMNLSRVINNEVCYHSKGKRQPKRMPLPC